LLASLPLPEGLAKGKLELRAVPLPRPCREKLVQMLREGTFGEGKLASDLAAVLVLRTLEEDQPRCRLLWIGYELREEDQPDLVRTGALDFDPMSGDICIVLARSTMKRLRYTVGRAKMAGPIVAWPVKFSPDDYSTWPVPNEGTFRALFGWNQDRNRREDDVTWTKAINYGGRLLIVSGGRFRNGRPLAPLRIFDVNLGDGVLSEVRLTPKVGSEEIGPTRK
jgi:hypothetical protein